MGMYAANSGSQREKQRATYCVVNNVVPAPYEYRTVKIVVAVHENRNENLGY